MLKWRGEQLIRKTDRKAVRAVDDTMREAVEYAKNNHPGWENRTGRAEDSIQVITDAREGRGGVFGRWGSEGVRYMLFLEFKQGGALRRAGDAVHHRLTRRLKF